VHLSTADAVRAIERALQLTSSTDVTSAVSHVADVLASAGERAPSIDDIAHALSDVADVTRSSCGADALLGAAAGALGLSRDGNAVVMLHKDSATHRAVWHQNTTRILDEDGLRALMGHTTTFLHAAARNVDHGHHASGRRSPWGRLRDLLVVEKSDITVVVLYAVFASVLSLVAPLAVQAMVSTAAFGTLLQPLLVLSFVVIVVLSVAAAVRVAMLALSERIQQRLFLRSVSELAHHLPRVDPAFARAHDNGVLINRFFDVLVVQKASAALLLDGSALVLELFAGLLLLAFYSPYFLAFSLALVVAVALIVSVGGRGAIRTSIDESYAKHDVAGGLERVARAGHEVRSVQGRLQTAGELNALAHVYLQNRRHHFSVIKRQAIGIYGVQAIATAALLGLGGALVVQGELSLGQLVAAELIVTSVLYGLDKLIKQLENIYDLVAALDKLGKLTEQPRERSGGHVLQHGHWPVCLLRSTGTFQPKAERSSSGPTPQAKAQLWTPSPDLSRRRRATSSSAKSISL
jgi:ABC-type bacteriocin/lantibiotic exporter with double-glycine peptidase domain